MSGVQVPSLTLREGPAPGAPGLPRFLFLPSPLPRQRRPRLAPCRAPAPHPAMVQRRLVELRAAMTAEGGLRGPVALGVAGLPEHSAPATPRSTRKWGDAEPGPGAGGR